MVDTTSYLHGRSRNRNAQSVRTAEDDKRMLLKQAQLSSIRQRKKDVSLPTISFSPEREETERQ